MAPHTTNVGNSLMVIRSSSLTRSIRTHNAHSRIKARRDSCFMRSIEETSAARMHRMIQRSHNPRTALHQHRYVACGLCKRNHRLLTCFKYQSMNVREKYEAVMQYHYCINCLARSHLVAKCTSRQKCSICNGKHHSSLHGHPGQRPAHSDAAQSVSRQAATIARLLTGHSLMPTALVRLRHDGVWHILRALINPTRKVSTIAAETTRLLGIPSTYVEPHLQCQVELGSRVDSAFRLHLCALVTKDLPSRPYDRDVVKEANNQFEHLTLADPHFTAVDKVLLELGADVYPRIVRKGLIVTDDNMPVAQQTVFGWTLAGPYEAEAGHCECKFN